MAVGASKPTVVAGADGFFSVKSKMLVSLLLSSFMMIACFISFACQLLCQYSSPGDGRSYFCTYCILFMGTYSSTAI